MLTGRESAVLTNCFKCTCHGRKNYYLTRMEIEDEEMTTDFTPNKSNKYRRDDIITEA